jgi:hypothetical protein
VFDREIDDAISQLVEQWDIAERRIKRAEFVNANHVISSAIFELRYAGRKLADANKLILEEKWQTSEKEKTRILAFLADATEDCVKSKHDSIDAMMLFVAAWFERTEKKLGLSEIQKYFPDYVQITGKIIQVQELISESRGDRTTLRDTIYDEIEKSGYDQILSLFQRMKVSEPRVQAEVRAERRRTRILVWGTILCVVLAVPALALAILAYVATLPAPH